MLIPVENDGDLLEMHLSSDPHFALPKQSIGPGEFGTKRVKFGNRFHFLAQGAHLTRKALPDVIHI